MFGEIFGWALLVLFVVVWGASLYWPYLDEPLELDVFGTWLREVVIGDRDLLGYAIACLWPLMIIVYPLFYAGYVVFSVVAAIVLMIGTLWRYLRKHRSSAVS